MKILQNIVLAAAALLLSVSCIREGDMSLPWQNEQPVMITLGATSRSGTDVGAPEDSYINSLRILGYRTSDGTLAFNEIVVGLPAVTNNANEIKKTVDVLTGQFTIVFIANEHSDKDTDSNGTSDLSALLNGITTAANNNISYLRGLSFSHEAFAADKNIPMVSVKENIIIQGDEQLIDPTQNSGNPVSEWKVSLTRIGIRVDVKLKLTDMQKTAWLGVANPGIVYFNNVPEKAYIFPNTDNSANLLTGDEKYATLTEEAKEGALNVFVCQRVILPESSSQTLTEAQALTMKIMEGAVARTGVVAPTPGVGTNGYTIPRNHYLDVVAAISGVEITLATTVAPWNSVNISGELEGPVVVLPEGTVQREANSYIIPKGWNTPILIPISQVTRGYTFARDAGEAITVPSLTGYYVSLMWSEMGTAGSTTTTTPDVVVRAAGDYISVQVNSNIEGNFVVEMTNSGGDYLWSWHIWVTAGYYPYDTTNDIPNTDTPNTTWMAYNLGAFNAVASGVPTVMTSTSNSALELDSRGLYYQWGRKDPFPMIDNIFDNAPLTTAADVLSRPRTLANNNTYFGTLGDAVANNSWDNSGSKTAFDPCPPGYKVPVGANPWSGGTWVFTPTLRGNTNTSYGGYYPYAGYRVESFNFNYVTYAGCLWSATSSTTSKSYNLFLAAASDDSGMASNYRFFGHSVRCVSE